MNYTVHYTLESPNNRENVRRDAIAQDTLFGRRCNNARTEPGDFNSDGSATRDSCGQVRKRAVPGERGRGPAGTSYSTMYSTMYSTLYSTL